MLGKIYAFAIPFLLLTSCYNNQESSRSVEKLALNINDMEQVKISSIIKSVDYIQLEKTPESIIGGISRVLFAGDKIYVLDGHHTKSLFVFANNGKFLYKIDRQGNGPGEYGYPMHFDLGAGVDANIFIGDVQRNKIIEYNAQGVFLKDHNIGIPVDNFIVFDSNRFGIAMSNVAESETKEGSSFHNFVMVENGKIKTKLFPIKAYLEHHAMSSSRYMSVYGKELYFHPPLTSSIYTYDLDSEASMLKYKIDFGIDMPEAGFFKQNFDNIGSAYKQEGYPRYLGFSQNSLFINISFNANGLDYEYFIDKASKKVIGTSKDRFIDDILCGGLNIKGVADDTYFGWFDLHELKDVIERNSDTYSDNKQLIGFIESLEENDNPIIVKYYCK